MISDHFELFTNFLTTFIKDKKIRTVAEIGSDPQLHLASQLTRSCDKVYSINLPQDHQRMQPSYELHKDLGGLTNLNLQSGNAVTLSSLVSHVDLILLQNVLLDLTGTDTELMWKYRRNELPCNDQLWEELISRFAQVETQAYREFLKVASPGYIIRFGRTDPQFPEFLTRLNILKERVEKKELAYDFETIWDAYIIDNASK